MYSAKSPGFITEPWFCISELIILLTSSSWHSHIKWEKEVCVCVYVCVWESECVYNREINGLVNRSKVSQTFLFHYLSKMVVVLLFFNNWLQICLAHSCNDFFVIQKLIFRSELSFKNDTHTHTYIHTSLPGTLRCYYSLSAHFQMGLKRCFKIRNMSDVLKTLKHLRMSHCFTFFTYFKWN